MTLTKNYSILILGIGDYSALRRDWELKNGRDVMQTTLSKSLTIFLKRLFSGSRVLSLNFILLLYCIFLLCCSEF